MNPPTPRERAASYQRRVTRLADQEAFNAWFAEQQKENHEK